jgi:PhnB protein
MAVKPVPDGYHNVTPYISVKNANALIDFMKQTFGARERMRMDGPNGAVGHAELEIGDSVIMCSDPMDRDITAQLYVYVDDCDATYQRALAAGATSEREPADQFYGDRTAGVRDRFGNIWFMATHVEDVPPDEMAKRSQEAMAQMQA